MNLPEFFSGLGRITPAHIELVPVTVAVKNSQAPHSRRLACTPFISQENSKHSGEMPVFATITWGLVTPIGH